MSVIDFSAQFGGQDAASAVLPHFKALKAACREVHLEGFSFPELAYILRVDGEVHQFNLSGAGFLEIDKDGEYLSVDIGIQRDDRGRIKDVISAAILSSVDLIEALKKSKALKFDSDALQASLLELVRRYKNESERANL